MPAMLYSSLLALVVFYLILCVLVFTPLGDLVLSHKRSTAYRKQYGVLAADPLRYNPALDDIPAWPNARHKMLSSAHPVTEHFALLELHHSLQTPILRTGPNQVHVADGESQRIVFGYSNAWDKGRLYALFEDDGVSDLFSYRSKEEHTPRRKLLSHAFAPARRRTVRPFIAHKVVALLEWMRDRSVSGVQVPIDMYMAFQTLTADVAVQFVFGYDAHMVEMGHLDLFTMQLRQRTMVHLSSLRASALAARVPLLAPLLKVLPRRVQDDVRALRQADEKVGRKIQTLLARGESDAGVGLFQKLAAVMDESKGAAASFVDLVHEGRNVTIGGVETTALTLTYLTWHLAKDDALYDTVLAELKTIIPKTVTDGSHLPDPEDIAKLPHVEALVKEVLRLYPAVAHALPRVVPVGGVTLHDRFLPAGTEVTSSSWVQHRWQSSQELWGPDPLAFRPTRWIEAKAEPERLAEMERSLVPFSTGPRACLGKDLAKDVLYLTTAALFRSLRPSRAGDKPGLLTPDESMTLLAIFTSFPKDQKLEVRWEAVV